MLVRLLTINYEKIEEGSETNEMGSITLRKDGRWMGRVSINKRSYCVYGKTKKECKEKLAELENDKKQLSYNTMNLYTFTKEYLDVFKKPLLKESSYIQLIKILDRFKNNELFTLSVVKINHLDLQKYFMNCDKKYTSYPLIKETFTKATEIGLIKLNPMALITKPAKKSSDSINDRLHELEQVDINDEIFTQTELNIIKEWCNAREEYKDVWLLFKLLLCTGLRIGEALALQKKDFNFENKTIKVYKNYDYVYSKSLSTTKTTKGTRFAPIFDTLERDIKPFLNRYNDEDFIFLANAFNISKLAYCLRLIERDTSIHIHYHKFRKTFISLCQFKLNIPQNVVAEWVGHNNVSTTFNYYTYLPENVNKESVESTEFDT